MAGKDDVKTLKERHNALRRFLDIDQRRPDFEENEKKTLAPDFWDNPKEAEKFLKILSEKKSWITRYDNVTMAVDELEVALEFLASGDMSQEEFDQTFSVAQTAIEELEFFNMLSGEEDKLSSIITINSGAGGTESQDWAEMLMRMYMRWAERNNFKVTELDMQAGDVAGIKSCSLEIEGDYAFGYLKSESGVHRLVRLSPFDANERRHTSFASVYAYPVVDDNIDIVLNPADLDWDTFRSSGPGGQNVNKVETAVRVRHAPSGIVVECQVTRSQLQNREKAIQMLKSQLYELELRKKREAIDAIESSKKKIEWGSQIRSYVLHPYRMVKDNRTSYETSDTQGVLDGDIQGFIKAYLMQFGRA
ncbi:MAG TPA: peptide chain release factor 2 [Bacteroidales bacterium]|nr:peptide chain release factor 2 [Bacteroidales bacterium]HCB60502.1 peptide chain release factor 2 [Bacteroidales bacterium]HCY22541.1 peptide chain release factor 2 [Bacteroidales bacterium]